MTFTALYELLNVFVSSIRGFWFGAEPVFFFFLSAAVIGLPLHLDEHVENKTLDHKIQNRLPFL